MVGDVWEGTGTHKPRIRIAAHDLIHVDAVLVRSGKRKQISLETIKRAYRLIERGALPVTTKVEGHATPERGPAEPPLCAK